MACSTAHDAGVMSSSIPVRVSTCAGTGRPGAARPVSSPARTRPGYVPACGICMEPLLACASLRDHSPIQESRAPVTSGVNGHAS